MRSKRWLALTIAHLGLDPAEVVFAEGLAVGKLEVVVEAVGDRGSDRVLGAGEQSGDRLGQHVRGRVPQHLAPSSLSGTTICSATS